MLLEVQDPADPGRDLRPGPPDQGAHLRPADCHVRAALPFGLLRQPLLLLRLQPRQRIPRRKLDPAQLEAEVRVLERMGHKRLALEAGEDPVNCPLDYILDCIQHHLRPEVRERCHPAGEHQHRRHHGGGLPAPEGRRHRHLRAVPGDLPQAHLPGGAPGRPQAQLPVPHRGPRPGHGGRHRRTWAWACCTDWTIWKIRHGGHAHARRAPGGRQGGGPAHPVHPPHPRRPPE